MKLLLKALFILGIFSQMIACHRAPPLPAELAAVKCWKPENHFHAQVPFGQAKVTYLCETEKRAATPEYLKCDPDVRPLECRDKGLLILSRTPKGHVYAVNGGLGHDLDQRETTETQDATGYTSELTLVFSTTPDWKALEMYESYFQFDEAREYLPRFFSLQSEVLCHRYASWLGAGHCRFIAKTSSLHWYISVAVYKDNQTDEVTESEYRREFIFWRNYMQKIIADPAP